MSGTNVSTPRGGTEAYELVPQHGTPGHRGVGAVLSLSGRAVRPLLVVALITTGCGRAGGADDASESPAQAYVDATRELVPEHWRAGWEGYDRGDWQKRISCEVDALGPQREKTGSGAFFGFGEQADGIEVSVRWYENVRHAQNYVVQQRTAAHTCTAGEEARPPAPNADWYAAMTTSGGSESWLRQGRVTVTVKTNRTAADQDVLHVLEALAEVAVEQDD
ncbi:hypothetical protein ACWDTR_20535 [Streptomyces sp. NPDC003470]|uniref:hypothetical protein n=1 Tax=Streptomyces sp. NPDC059701 TaxID=3346914 RepID=UPI003678C179